MYRYHPEGLYDFGPDSLFSDFVVLEDLDHDGVRDFLYGMAVRKRHRVVSGADWTELAHWTDQQFPLHSGHGGDVAAVGDWDGDGVGDYAVGAASAELPGAPEQSAGSIRIFSGAHHGRILQILADAPGWYLGHEFVNLGDLNGDGFPELAAPARYPSPFRVNIYSAPDGAFLRGHFSGDFATSHVEPCPDVDGDGVSEYVISEHTPPWQGARLFSGATGASLRYYPGVDSLVGTGFSFDVSGDWDGDGFPEIVMGAPGAPSAVLVASGADAGLLRRFRGEDYGAGTSHEFGAVVSARGDLSGDGFPDLVVGAPLYSEPGLPAEVGAVFVISGRTGAMLWKLVGHDSGQHLGERVDMLDDLDGDGLCEWLVIDPGFLAGAGRIVIYAGAVGDAWTGCAAGAGAPGEARLFAAGPIGLRENALQLAVEDAAPASAGFVLCGVPAAATPFGTGALCLGGSPQVAAVVTTDASGNAWVPLDLWHAPLSPTPGALAAGDTRAFQYVYRPPGASQPATSAAVLVRFLP